VPSVSDVVLTVVPDEAEAEMICGMLAANGVRSWYQQTNQGAALWTGAVATVGPIQVLVDSDDIGIARKLLAGT
jgi:hypothetical protein